MIPFVFARVPSVACLDIFLRPRYVGVVHAGDGHNQIRRINKHTKVEFEWVLKGPTSTATERVEVRNDSVKERGVPLPDAWTNTSIAHVHKMCAAASAKAMRDLPGELHEGGAAISCQPAP